MIREETATHCLADSCHAHSPFSDALSCPTHHGTPSHSTPSHVTTLLSNTSCILRGALTIFSHQLTLFPTMEYSQITSNLYVAECFRKSVQLISSKTPAMMNMLLNLLSALPQMQHECTHKSPLILMPLKEGGRARNPTPSKFLPE